MFFRGNIKNHFLLCALLSAFHVFITHASACTTILVNDWATTDGSKIIARNDDYFANAAQHFIIHSHSNQSHIFVDGHGLFQWELNNPQLRYSSISNFDAHDKTHGEAGFNEYGLGVSATESIYNNSQVLAIDPYVKTGITEDSIEDVILSQAKSAKEGVILLGHIIETSGAGEGFGVAFIDSNDIWYMETGSGHQWLAKKITGNKYFISANKLRLGLYNPNTTNEMASSELISFAIKHGLWRKSDTPFDFKSVYGDNKQNDIIYNNPRIDVLKAKLTSIEEGDGYYSEFLQPKNKISIEDIKGALRGHYINTKHDPYSNSNNRKDVWYPISSFSTVESHILQVRPFYPDGIRNVQYVAIGMPDLSVYIPYYAGSESYPLSYHVGDLKFSYESAYWTYRQLQTLVMQNYELYSPDVKRAYHEFELTNSAEQKKIESEWLSLYQTSPKKAYDILRSFQVRSIQDALDLTQRLTKQLITKMTWETEKKQRIK